MGFANHKAGFFYLRRKTRVIARQLEEDQSTIDALMRQLAARRDETEVLSTAEFVEASIALGPRAGGAAAKSNDVGRPFDTADDEEAATFILMMVA